MRIKISKRKKITCLTFYAFYAFCTFYAFYAFYACEITPNNLIYYTANLASRKSKTTFKLQWKVFLDIFEHRFMRVEVMPWSTQNT